jgi:hypothetical protein
VIRIDVLPDDVLLGVFDFFIITNLSHGGKTGMEAWQSLVHVCRRWRNLILGSPRHLNLRLFCTSKTPTKDTLDVWPALPLVVEGNMTLSGTDNIIAALELSNRVCQVSLRGLAGCQLEKVLVAMQVPFPDLTDLQLFSDGETLPVIPVPDSFLGGSAPRLRIFTLDGIPFPGLSNLLLFADHLVDLALINIPHSGYFSPKAIAALLFALSSLGTLHLGFQSPQSRPDWISRSLPPLKRFTSFTLPALKEFHFKGVTEYLEELVTRIDTPRLNGMDITFFNQINFDFPRLAQFVHSTPTLRARNEAHVQFDDYFAGVGFRYRTSTFSLDNLLIKISCREPDWQLLSIEQICNCSLHPLSVVEDLYFEHQYSQLVWKNGAIEDALWLPVLLPFIAVKNLYLSKEFGPDIAAALQELVGDRITEVLPSLQNIFVEGLEPWGPFQENIGQFAAVRRRSGHPITISVWDKD